MQASSQLRSLPALVAAVLLFALALPGCASSHDRTSATHVDGAAGHAAAVRLTIAYSPPHGQVSARTTWSLRCGPAGGDHPRRRVACRELLRDPAGLGRARHVCRTRAQPGSPYTTVTGSDHRRSVNRLYRPGCDDWGALHTLLTGR